MEWEVEVVADDVSGSRHISRSRRHVQSDRILDIHVVRGPALLAAGLGSLMSMFKMARVERLTRYDMEQNLCR